MYIKHYFAKLTYIVKPINFASLKFSGRFLVLTAYNVQSIIRKRFQKNDVKKANVVVEQMSTIRRG